MSIDYKKLMQELELDEGKRLKPYTDTVGKLTIGIGRNLSDVGISEIECNDLFSNDIIRAEKGLDKWLPWWRELSDIRKRVMLNMAFNLGIQGLLKFNNTLKAIHRADWKTAVEGMMDSLWHKQVGNRALRLEHMMLKDEDVPVGLFGKERE